MKILGLNCSYKSIVHDPSACLMINGKIVNAMEEERFNRVKTSLGYFPYYSIKNILFLRIYSGQSKNLNWQTFFFK